MQVEVEAKKSEADKVAEIVGKEKKKVMKETDKANVEADKASQIKAEVEDQKASTEKDLNDALPLKDKAKAALQDISVKDFPGNFKEVLMEIPRLIEENQIPAQNINPIRAYLNEPFFKPEIMESKSLAAKGICSYIIN
jgi:dynein heavy chain